jgi:hypothetical protein
MARSSLANVIPTSLNFAIAKKFIFVIKFNCRYAAKSVLLKYEKEIKEYKTCNLRRSFLKSGNFFFAIDNRLLQLLIKLTYMIL